MTPCPPLRRARCRLVLSGLALFLALPAAAQSDQQRAAAFAASLSLPRMQADLQELQAVADASGGNRAASTPGHEASADYIQSQLQGLGLRTWRESIEYPVSVESSESLLLGGPGGTVIDVLQLGRHTTPPQGVQGQIVLAPDAVGCTVESWGDTVLDGRAALVRATRDAPCGIRTQVQVAQALGAVALLTPTHPGAYKPHLLGALPALFIYGPGADEGEAILARVAAGEHLQALVHTSYTAQTRSTFNVLAETDGEGPVIMLGAHLDSVPAGPGMDDNASGAVAVLDVAREAAALHLPGRLRFAWWGAEELGLIGSSRHVEALDAAGQPALRDIRAYLNADMLASPNYALGLQDPEPDGGGAAAQRMQIHAALDDYFTAMNLPRVLVSRSLAGASDHAPFRVCGLATGGVSSYVGRGDKTPEEQALFGGVAGQPYSPDYHQAGDRLENTSPVALEVLSRAMAYAMVRLALAPPPAVLTPQCSRLELDALAGQHQLLGH